MQVDSLIEEVIAREGGFVDHKADRGGATRWGITEAVARAEGYAGPMRSLPRQAAHAIYRRRYWAAPGFDKVAERAPMLDQIGYYGPPQDKDGKAKAGKTRRKGKSSKAAKARRKRE